MNCPLCLSKGLQALYRGVGDFEHGVFAQADFYRCSSCGLITQYPPPSADQLKRFYPADYRPYSSTGIVSRLKDIQASLLVSKLSAELPNKRQKIIELGCGGGHFLRQLKKRGYSNLSALDWSNQLTPIFERLGIEFHLSDIEQLDLKDSFDCVVMNNVIEHLLEPERVLARIKASLAPGGKILVLTPNSESLSHKFFGKYWAGLHAPRHINIFNPQSLEVLSSRLGFSRTKFVFLTDPSAWTLSFQNTLRAKSNQSAAARSGTTWWAILSLPAWYPAALIEHAMSRSSSMVISLS